LASEVVSHVTRSADALRLALWEETIHVPPPTLPVAGVVSPGQVSGAAAEICPAGVLKAALNRYCPYQEGP
jgi:hypothetical protein